MSTLSDILQKLASGQNPGEIPIDCECRAQLLELITYLDELKRFVAALSSGDMNATLRLPGPLAGSLKGLHANLRHLTWQTQQVAAGDFSQRVDFLGAFSDAFNSMVSALAQARDDLTERNQQLADTCEQLKSTQSQLLQQEKMASIGQLAAGVAHEINNPMGFISSNLGALGKYTERLKTYSAAVDEVLAAPTMPAELREQLAASRKSLKVDFMLEDIPSLLAESSNGAERVRKIVQDLKGFSRIDAAEYAIVDLNQCLESTIHIFGNALDSKARLTTQFGEIPTVTCLPQQLNQVFMNLLQNATQAVEREGEVRVRTSCDNDNVYVEISDNGCGIAPDHLGRIFEPFFTTRPVGKGTGLGLSIAYDIVKKHGGEISVTSAVNKGSIFRVRIPLEAPPPEEATP
jgi:two-component system NtrC family sensor kinase